MKRAAITSYLSLMCYGLCVTVIGPALGMVGETFALSPGRLGLFTTTLSVGIIPAVLLGGYIVDRYGVRIVGVVGQLLMTAGFLLFSLTATFWVGLLAFFIMGMAGGVIEIVTNTVISGLYPHKRASALNLLHAFFGVGALIGPVLSGGLIDAGVGWQPIYWIAAAIAAAVAVLLIASPLPDQVSAEKVDFFDFLAIAKSPIALLFGLMLVLYVGSEMGITYWSPLFLSGRFSLSALVAGSFLSYFWIAITAGRFVVFLAAKKISDRLLLFILTVCSFFSYALYVWAPTGWLSGLGLTLVGLFFSGIFPTVLGMGVNRFSRVPGTITGFMMTFMGVGMLIFPPAIGLIADASSLFTGMLLILSLLGCLTLITAAFGLKRKGSAGH